MTAGLPVPDLAAYFGVDELRRRSERLAERCPGAVTLTTAGASRRGEPILALEIGEGDPVLAYGFPHPNEPIGGTALDCLAEALASDADLRRGLGLRWHIVKCADPDAARLNQGWFGGPFTPVNYALHYFRQPATEQVEWGFPAKYKDLVTGEPIPEVRALMGLIDRVRPRFLFSLHNSNFSGVYYWVHREEPALYPVLRRVVAEVGLPLHLGEPEHAIARQHAPGVYRWAPISEMYDYFARHFQGADIPAVLGTGSSCEEYAARVSGAFSLAMEVPIFSSPVIADTTLTGVTRRQAALDEIDELRAFYAFMREQATAVAGLLSPSYHEATMRTYERLDGTLASRVHYVTGDEDFARLATVAEVADRRHMHRLNRMLPLGMFIRVVEGRLKKAGGEAAARLLQAKERLLTRLLEEDEALKKQITCAALPIRCQVDLVLRSMLETLRYFRGRGRDG